MKILSVLLVSTLFTIQLKAQNQVDNGQKAPARVRLEDLEIRDSSGAQYPPVIWQQLLSSGKYNIRMMPDRKTAIIYRMTESEIGERLSKMPKPANSKFFTTGKTISSFNERDMYGKRFNLKELAGKVVALNFWFINCGPCRREMPEMNEMVEGFKDNKEVVFIGISLDEKSQIEEFLKTNPFLYNIIDNGRYIASMYNVNLYPTHVILDRQGKVVFHTSGVAMNTVPWVKKSIESALNDLPPANQ